MTHTSIKPATKIKDFCFELRSKDNSWLPYYISCDNQIEYDIWFETLEKVCSQKRRFQKSSSIYIQQQKGINPPKLLKRRNSFSHNREHLFVILYISSLRHFEKLDIPILNYRGKDLDEIREELLDIKKMFNEELEKLCHLMSERMNYISRDFTRSVSDFSSIMKVFVRISLI